jgi:NADH dehydrogenase/putative oxidoreductase
VYIASLRIWLALALLVVVSLSRLQNLDMSSPLAAWLPLQVAARVPGGVASVVGTLLLLGLGTRYVGLVMIPVLFADAMIDASATDTIYLLMIFSILIVYGGGLISSDRLIAVLLTKRFPRLDVRDPRALDGLPRVVIVGAGFGGVSCAAALRSASVAVTVIDQTNFHLFQPLLYQVATAALSPGDIAAPVRSLFRNDFGIRVLLGLVTGVDPQRQIVRLNEQEIPYDYLVLATGATHSYFGKEGWAPYAPGLKRVEDAIEIRRKILTAFEQAEATADAERRASLLTFLIVGGGPTGVELAGAIAELARFGMDKEFRMFDPADARVILVQSAPRLLPAFPETLAVIAQRSLEKLGVQVLLGSRVEDIDPGGVVVSGKKILASTVLWAAGVTASPAAKWLKADCDSAGRIKVGADLGVPGISNVFAIGDTALSSGWKGKAVPGLAPAAKQGGTFVARQIRARVEARPPRPAFKYRHLGSLATIGRKAAVADFGFVKLWGEPAWWLWGMVHVGFLVGTRNRIATLINWFWAYLTFSGGIRLITGGGESSSDRKPR